MVHNKPAKFCCRFGLGYGCGLSTAALNLLLSLGVSTFLGGGLCCLSADSLAIDASVSEMLHGYFLVLYFQLDRAVKVQHIRLVSASVTPSSPVDTYAS